MLNQILKALSIENDFSWLDFCAAGSSQAGYYSSTRRPNQRRRRGQRRRSVFANRRIARGF